MDAVDIIVLPNLPMLALIMAALQLLLAALCREWVKADLPRRLS